MNARDNIREQLSAYLDGELTPAQSKVVEQTLAHDADLARELEELRATRELLQSLPKASAPTDFAAKVMAEARRRGLAGPVANKPAGRRWLRVAGIAAMLVMAMGLGMLLSQKVFHQPTGEPHQEIASTPAPEPTETPRDALADGRGRADLAGRLDGVAHSPAPVVESVSEAPIGKGGVTYDTYEGRVARSGSDLGYNFRDNMDDARNEAFAALDEINGQTVEIYVDDIASNQKAVEQVMFANGIALAPDEQAVIAPNQAVNLMTNRNFVQAQNARPAADVEEVQYLVYGKQEQLQQLAKALQDNVVRRQTVSQLPEPFFRRAIEAGDGDADELAKANGWTPGCETDLADAPGESAEDKEDVPTRERSREAARAAASKAGPVPTEPVAVSPAPEPEPVSPYVAEPVDVAEGARTKAGEEAEDRELAEVPAGPNPAMKPAADAAPAPEAEFEGASGAWVQTRRAERARESSEVHDVVAPPATQTAGGKAPGMASQVLQGQLSDANMPTTQAEGVQTALEDDKVDQPQRAVRMSQVGQSGPTLGVQTQDEAASLPQPTVRQQGYVLRGDAVGVPATDAMIITLRRRVSPSRLNRLQQRNVDFVERQYDQVRNAEASQPQAAPVSTPSQPANNAPRQTGQ